MPSLPPSILDRRPVTCGSACLMVALPPAGDIGGQDGGKSVFDAALPRSGPWRSSLGRYSTPNNSGGGWLVGLTPAPRGLAYAGILGSPSGVTGGRLVARFRRADHSRTCPFIGVKRSRGLRAGNDAIDPTGGMRDFG